MGDKEADCQGRRYLRTEKAAMTCMRTVTERLGPLQGEGWVWVTKRRTVKDAGYLRTEKAAMTCGFFCSEVPSRIELLYTVLQTVA